MKPLIGITAAAFVNDKGVRYQRVYEKNIESIVKAGGLPILLPSNVSSDVLRAIYERVDAVLLPGGGDIDPEYYGAERHPKTDEIDLMRDEAEIKVTQWAAEDDLPLLGICRGIQVMNVALGGTLVQDIASELETEITHERPQGKPRYHRAHPVQVEADTLLANVLGNPGAIDVNTLHHQAIGQTAPGVIVSGRAPDGIVEAIELPGKSFFLSVQWHPEDLFADDQDVPAQHIFEAFVEAARERAQRRAAHV